MKDTEIEELGKCECVSSVMTIAYVINIEIEKMGPLGIFMITDDGVYVCNCTVYSYVLKQHTQHAFVYNSYFSTKENSAFHGAIIDNRTYAPICVLEEKYRKVKATLKNMLRNFFEGTYIVKYAFKVTSHDYSSYITDLYLLLYCDLTHQFVRLKTETNSYSNLLKNWFGYDTISE